MESSLAVMVSRGGSTCFIYTAAGKENTTLLPELLLANKTSQMRRNLKVIYIQLIQHVREKIKLLIKKQINSNISYYIG